MTENRRGSEQVTAESDLPKNTGAYFGPDDDSADRHPESRADADATSSAGTDTREAAQDPERGLGGRWTGETAPDAQFRENPPTRRDVKDVDAPDAF